MSSRRLLKAAEAVREVVSMAILREVKDPRVRDVTVTYVEVAADMRSAKIHVSIMGNETQQQLGLRGLQHAAGFLQTKVRDRIDTRYTPRLTFVLDKGVKKSIEIARLLREVLPTDIAEGAEATAAASELAAGGQEDQPTEQDAPGDDQRADQPDPTRFASDLPGRS